MVTVMLESGKFNINQDALKLESEFPKSSVLKIDKSNYSSRIKVAEHMPLLTNTWFVIVNPNTPVTVIKELDALGCVCLIKQRSREKCDEFCAKLDKEEIKYDYIDSTRYSKKELEEFVIEQLEVDSDTAQYLCSRCKYSATIISDNIYMLQSLDNIDKSTIKEYVDARADVNFHYLTLAILGYKWKYPMKYKACVKLLDQYRYGSKTLYRILNDSFEEINTVYNDYYSGTLTMENSIDYKGIKSRYVLDYLRLAEQVSYDYFLYVWDTIRKIYTQDQSFNIKLIALLIVSRDS